MKLARDGKVYTVSNDPPGPPLKQPPQPIVEY